MVLTDTAPWCPPLLLSPSFPPSVPPAVVRTGPHRVKRRLSPHKPVVYTASGRSGLRCEGPHKL